MNRAALIVTLDPAGFGPGSGWETASTSGDALAQVLRDQAGFTAGNLVRLGGRGPDGLLRPLLPAVILETARDLLAQLEEDGLFLLVLSGGAHAGPGGEICLHVSENRYLLLSDLEVMLDRNPRQTMLRIFELWEQAWRDREGVAEQRLLRQKPRWVTLAAIAPRPDCSLGPVVALTRAIREAATTPLPPGIHDPFDLALHRLWEKEGDQRLAVQMPKTAAEREGLCLLLPSVGMRDGPRVRLTRERSRHVHSPTGSSSTEAQTSKLGRLIDGRYQIISRIGAGAMGVVYRAHQLSVRRDVALKVVRPNRELDDHLVARFLREMHTISRLHHPNLVSVYDAGQTEDGLFYMAMELLDGETLFKLLRRCHPLPPEQIVAILNDVCRGLAEAHRHGVTHRDLKPDNIFLWDVGEEQPTVRLLDFGTALLGEETEQRGRLTLTGAVVGTPLYMSPEQALGRVIGPRADIYALGVILYELLTGHPPFEGTGLGILLQHAHQQPPPLRSPRAEPIPSHLEDLALRALAKEPDLRPADVPEFRRLLQAAGDRRLIRSPGAASDATPTLTSPPPAFDSVLSPLVVPERTRSSGGRELEALASRETLTELNSLAPIRPASKRSASGDAATLILSSSAPENCLEHSGENSPACAPTPEMLAMAQQAQGLLSESFMPTSRLPSCGTEAQPHSLPEPAPRVKIVPTAPQPAEPAPRVKIVPTAPQPAEPAPRVKIVPSAPEPAEPAPRVKMVLTSPQPPQLMPRGEPLQRQNANAEPAGAATLRDLPPLIPPAPKPPIDQQLTEQIKPLPPPPKKLGRQSNRPKPQPPQRGTHLWQLLIILLLILLALGGMLLGVWWVGLR